MLTPPLANRPLDIVIPFDLIIHKICIWIFNARVGWRTLSVKNFKKILFSDTKDSEETVDYESFFSMNLGGITTRLHKSTFFIQARSAWIHYCIGESIQSTPKKRPSPKAWNLAKTVYDRSWSGLKDQFWSGLEGPSSVANWHFLTAVWSGTVVRRVTGHLLIGQIAEDLLETVS